MYLFSPDAADRQTARRVPFSASRALRRRVPHEVREVDFDALAPNLDAPGAAPLVRVNLGAPPREVVI
jgi:hypothetical protein